jgi:hypothetical protein
LLNSGVRNEKGQENYVREHHWLEEFQKRTAARLRKIFEADLGDMPKDILDKMEELRRKEQQLIKRNKK